jgi:hypothetical protein
MKDKRQLAAVPNMFLHIERLLDQGKYEIIFNHYFFFRIKYFRNQQNSNHFIRSKSSSKNRFTRTYWR